MVSSYKQVQDYKSPWPVIAGFLHRSRENQRRRGSQWKERCERLAGELERARAREQAALAEAARAKEIARQAQAEVERLKSQPVRLPSDPPLPKHQYGARLISLCLSLAQKVGLRATPVVLKIMWDWLGVQEKVPHPTAVRGWLQRMGLALLEEHVERADDWIWLADHSNQIGSEKVLAVLGVRASQLPPPGQLGHGGFLVADAAAGPRSPRHIGRTIRGKAPLAPRGARPRSRVPRQNPRRPMQSRLPRIQPTPLT